MELIEKPISVAIETTNFCNAKCCFCPNSTLKRKKDIMSQELFEKIIKDCVEIQPKYILPILNGEPFLDPDIVSRIKFINNKLPDSKVMLFTNANLMTPKISDQLLDLNIYMVTFSINAADEEKYSQRMKLNYKTTIDNINSFIKNNNVSHIKFSMIAQNTSPEEIEEFKKIWGKNTFIGKYTNFSGSMYNPNPLNNPCSRALKEMNILHNGDVSLCCMDMEGKMIFGNITHNHLLDIWNNEKMKKLRTVHLSNNRNKYPLCDNCNQP
ncbi:radical SAM protein [Candidatus Woesearchaeota archaeon]|nr:radical SAM protein [Candidatus Woesearchaeota archaeon]